MHTAQHTDFVNERPHRSKSSTRGGKAASDQSIHHTGFFWALIALVALVAIGGAYVGGRQAALSKDHTLHAERTAHQDLPRAPKES